MTDRPTADEIKAMARVAGVPVTVDDATRIANSIGPAFDGFAPIAGKLPFDVTTILRVGTGFQRTTDFHTKVPELP